MSSWWHDFRADRQRERRTAGGGEITVDDCRCREARERGLRLIGSNELRTALTGFARDRA
jgi:hypothetical protein